MIIHFADGGYAECHEISYSGNNIVWDDYRFAPIDDVVSIEEGEEDD